ncbi:hypothetical protein BJ508DRAFT_163983 [Ascobolus immersus RN42]|uniref:Uncharacterized protein n=1 Tax=Ascobolus immersus RN42 TaxID=1160509 RepID=A0A3N4HXG0_ASCIM|nr:hypothetical protein BJ508DRAFT_163983 [Ascobolus immersus RN42]
MQHYIARGRSGYCICFMDASAAQGLRIRISAVYSIACRGDSDLYQVVRAVQRLLTALIFFTKENLSTSGTVTTLIRDSW